MRYRIFPKLCNTKHCKKSMKKLKNMRFRINHIKVPSLSTIPYKPDPYWCSFPSWWTGPHPQLPSAGLTREAVFVWGCRGWGRQGRPCTGTGFRSKSVSRKRSTCRIPCSLPAGDPVDLSSYTLSGDEVRRVEVRRVEVRRVEVMRLEGWRGEVRRV